MHELLGSSHRGRLSALLAAFALCVAAALAFVPAAFATEGVTRSIDGLNYTLPADWEEVDAAQALVDAMEASGGDTVDVSEVQATFDQLGLVAYSKGDGAFLAFVVPGEELGVDSGEIGSEEAAALAGYVQAMVEDTPLASVTFSSGTDQGLPIMSATTTDIVFNDVVYALTLQLYFNAGADASDVVFMASFLPASGTVNDNALDGVEALDEAATISAAGITYEVPAGMSLAEGSVFGYGFSVAASEDPARVLYAISIPNLDELASVTVDDLQELAEQLYDSVVSSEEATSVLSSFWTGAYSFVGYPTLGVEGVATEEGVSYYFCTTASVTGQGVSVLVILQDADDTFADGVLASAAADASFVVVEDAADGTGDDAGNGAGFVVGLPAA